MAAHKDVKRKTWFVHANYRDEDGKIKTMTKRGFLLKRDADAYEEAFRKGPDAVDGYETFESLVEKFLADRKGNANEESIKEYRRIIITFMSDIMKKKVKRIKPKDMIEIKANILSTEYSKRYKNTAISMLKSISKFGNIYYDFSDSAKTLSKIKESSDDFFEMKVWTPSEFEIFIQYVKNYVYKAYFIFLFRTGARRSEGKALFKTDIQGEYAIVDKSIKHNSNGTMPLKTAYSRRKIKLDKYTLEILKPLLERSGSYLFGDDEPISISSIQREFTKALKACNEDLIKNGSKELPVIRIHDLRHSHATYLINKGANIVAVSRRLGHSDINMTLKVYTHLLQESEDHIVELLDEITL